MLYCRFVYMDDALVCNYIEHSGSALVFCEGYTLEHYPLYCNTIVWVQHFMQAMYAKGLPIFIQVISTSGMFMTLPNHLDAFLL